MYINLTINVQQKSGRCAKKDKQKKQLFFVSAWNLRYLYFLPKQFYIQGKTSCTTENLSEK